RTPEATALVCRGVALNFAEVNARANRLAHHLIARGVGPERVVGMALPRSAELVVALLAVLKAGGVYLPIDPELPADRIAFLLQDAGAVLTLSTGDPAASVVALDDPALLAELAGQPDTAPEPAPRPEHAAYVIYTSGSTGR